MVGRPRRNHSSAFKAKVSRQAQLLGMSRSTVHYLPWAVGDSDLELMRQINQLHLEHLTLGSRMLR